MKKKQFSLLFGIASVFAIASFTLVNSNGSEVHLTGSPVDGPGTCKYCHGGGSATVSPIIKATPAFGAGNTFVPGTTYTLSVGETGFPDFGFDLEICNNNTRTCSDGGTFVATVSNCQFHSPTSRFPTNVTHTATISASSAATFKWKAPSSGNAYLYFCINGVDGDGTNSGDQPFNDSILLTPASATAIINPIENDRNLNFFPNPSTGCLHFSYSLEKQSTVSIRLYGCDGKFISSLYSGMLEAGDQNYTALLPAGLNKGIYMVQLIVDEQPIRKMLVVQ